MKWNRHSRRAFLQGVGGAVLPLPFLPSLAKFSSLSDVARAQSLSAPAPYFLGISSLNGVTKIDRNWIPSGYDPNKIDGMLTMTEHHLMRKASIASVSGSTSISTLLGARLKAIGDKITIFQGLDSCGKKLAHGTNGGGDSAVFGDLYNYEKAKFLSLPNGGGKWFSVPTIDEVMAYSKKNFYPVDGNNNLIFPGNECIRVRPDIDANNSTHTRGYHNPLNSTGKLVSRTSLSNDAEELFNLLIGGVVQSPSADTGKKSTVPLIVDRVHQDYRDLQNKKRRGRFALSSEDRTVIDNHMQYLFQVQRGLSSGRNVSASCGVSPVEGSQTSLNANSTIAEATAVFENFTNVLVAALACGVSRVATMSISYAFQGIQWHDLSHAVGSQGASEDAALLDTIVQWTVESTFAQAVEQLDQLGILGQGVVYWSNENSERHETASLPVLLAGGANGRLSQQGQFIDYTNYNVKKTWSDAWGSRGIRKGVLINRLYNTIFQAVGLKPSDYESSSIGAGYGMRSDDGNFYDLSLVGKKLPWF